MAATPTLQSTKLLALCQEVLPTCVFQAADSFYWSPRGMTIYFDPASLSNSTGQLALLHEVSHALLNHSNYHSDVELLFLEASAWQEAIRRASQWSMDIVDTNHIEDCLDTYRDWLYARSSCPTCMVGSLQVSAQRYTCPNCLTTWTVSPSRFCRPYRMQSRGRKIPPSNRQTVFQ